MTKQDLNDEKINYIFISIIALAFPCIIYAFLFPLWLWLINVLLTIFLYLVLLKYIFKII